MPTRLNAAVAERQKAAQYHDQGLFRHCIQSDSVRQLVEQAKERHELRSRTRQLCMEHLQELRKMRWVMHRNFELCL